MKKSDSIYWDYYSVCSHPELVINSRTDNNKSLGALTLKGVALYLALKLKTFFATNKTNIEITFHNQYHNEPKHMIVNDDDCQLHSGLNDD